MKINNIKMKLIIAFILTCSFYGNSFAWFWEDDYLVKVNGEIIDLEDYEKRLSEMHRQRSMQGEMKKPSGADFKMALEEMIDDFLLYQEGRRIGMSKDPDFIRKATAYLEFQSILRLRKEEVKDKIEVSEDEIRKFYDKNFIKSAKEGMKPPDYKAVKGLIRKSLYSKKEKDRENEYLGQIKKKARIEIYPEPLASLGKNKADANLKIASVNGKSVYASDLEKEYGKALAGKSGEEADIIRKRALEGLIDYLLIKEDALSHNYPEEDPHFGKMIKQYRVSLLSAIMKKKIISPGVKISEKDSKEYYNNNKEKYRRAGQYKLIVIKLKDEKEAGSLLRELRAGSDFNRMARLKSEKLKGRKNNLSWWNEAELSPQVRDAVMKMNVGDISDLIKEKQYYKIVKLVDIKKGAIMSYSEARAMIDTHLGREKFKSLLEEYLKRLRERSSILINQESLEDFEKNFKMKVNNAE